MSRHSTKVIIGDGDNALTFDEDLILEITASQSCPNKTEEHDSSHCAVKIYCADKIDYSTFEKLKTIYTLIPICVYMYTDNYDKLYGTYYIDEYTFTDNYRVVEITAYDVLYFMGKTMYDKGTMSYGTKLAELSKIETLLQDIISDASEKLGINIEKFEEDALPVDLTYRGYIGYISHREALRQISELSETSMYVIPSGKIRFGKFYFPIGNANGETGFPKDENNIIDNSLYIDSSNVRSGCKIIKHNFVLSTELIAIAETGDIALTGEEQIITVEYATYPAKVETVAYKTDSSMKILEQHLYSERAVFKIKGTADDTGWITLTGYEFKDLAQTLELGGQSNPLEISNNYLIDVYSSVTEDYFSWKEFTMPKYSFSCVIDEFRNQGCQVGHRSNDNPIMNAEHGTSMAVTKITRTITPDAETFEVEGYPFVG